MHLHGCSMLGDVMNKTLMATILATCTLFAIPSVATASDYGCKVLLCLAASGGTPAECKPTLKNCTETYRKAEDSHHAKWNQAQVIQPELSPCCQNPAAVLRFLYQPTLFASGGKRVLH